MAAYCYTRCAVVGMSVCLSPCLLVTLVSPAKTAEPIEMPFGGLSHTGPRRHDGGHVQRRTNLFESIGETEDCDAAFCQNSLTTTNRTAIKPSCLLSVLMSKRYRGGVYRASDKLLRVRIRRYTYYVHAMLAVSISNNPSVKLSRLFGQGRGLRLSLIHISEPTRPY